MFFSRELTCSNCERKLGSGDKAFIEITLPNERKMPVGVLDKVLSRYSDQVYCEDCYRIRNNRDSL